MPTSPMDPESSFANLFEECESTTIHCSRMSQRIDGCHCMPSKVLMLLPPFKLNFVLPVNIFTLGLRDGSRWSPTPFLPFFQIVVWSPSFVGLRFYHSSKLGSARWLCGCPLPLGLARRRCGHPLPPSSTKRPCSFARRWCRCLFPPNSTRQQCSRLLPLSYARPSCTSTKQPCGCPLSHYSSKRPRNFARQWCWRPLPLSSTRQPCT